MESKRVGLGPRAVALFFDFLAVISLSYLLLTPITWLMEKLNVLSFSIDTTGDAWAAIIYHLWFTALLYSLIEAFVGASPGKMLLGLRAGAADGAKAGPGLKLLRWFLKGIILLIVPPFGLVENEILITAFLVLSVIMFLGVFLALGKSRQTLYDRLSGTAVFRAKNLS
jgi:uncharacterized RDD family membrane protein YckC